MRRQPFATAKIMGQEAAGYRRPSGTEVGWNMWMSNCLIVVNSRNADHNSIAEIAAAVTETGASVIEIDEQKHVIEAAVPSHEVATVGAIDGVSYVRCVFNYFCGQMPPRAA